MSHDAAIRAALAHGQAIDLTTIGRGSGEPRRTETDFHAIDGRLYISGWPYPHKRDWLRNLEADLPATARVIDLEGERRAILAAVARLWRRDDLEAMVRESPLIAV